MEDDENVDFIDWWVALKTIQYPYEWITQSIKYLVHF